MAAGGYSRVFAANALVSDHLPRDVRPNHETKLKERREQRNGQRAQTTGIRDSSRAMVRKRQHIQQAIRAARCRGREGKRRGPMIAILEEEHATKGTRRIGRVAVCAREEDGGRCDAKEAGGGACECSISQHAIAERVKAACGDDEERIGKEDRGEYPDFGGAEQRTKKRRQQPRNCTNKQRI